MKVFLQSLFNFIKPNNIIGFSPAKRTVDGALIHFTRALDELRAVEVQENAEAARQEKTLADAKAALDGARREATRARSKAIKIEAFIGDDDEAVDSAPLRAVKT